MSIAGSQAPGQDLIDYPSPQCPTSPRAGSQGLRRPGLKLGCRAAALLRKSDLAPPWSGVCLLQDSFVRNFSAGERLQQTDSPAAPNPLDIHRTRPTGAVAVQTSHHSTSSASDLEGSTPDRVSMVIGRPSATASQGARQCQQGEVDACPLKTDLSHAFEYNISPPLMQDPPKFNLQNYVYSLQYSHHC